MNIPNLPSITVPISTNTGHMHPAWHFFFNQLLQEMQNNLSEEGIWLPQQSTENIQKLEASNPTNSILINKDTQEAYIALNGVFKKITTS